MIGLLISTAEFSGLLGSLLAAKMERRFGSSNLVLSCIFVSVLCIAATPIIASFLVALVGACILRGIANGISHPLMFAILSLEVTSDRHGASVGLRTAVIRIGAIVVPIFMGLVAETYGIEVGFYIVGALFLTITVLLGLFARRVPP